MHWFDSPIGTSGGVSRLPEASSTAVIDEKRGRETESERKRDERQIKLTKAAI
jgi:hypothetical protein